MSSRRCVGLALLVVFGLGACAEDGEAVVRTRLATFNLGLAFGLEPEASGRVDPIVSALNEADLDLVCLQELWTNQDESGAWTTDVIERVVSGVEPSYPHAYWSRTEAPEDAPETGCEPEEADVVLGCAEQACGDVPAENLADCALANCSEELGSTSPTCQSCLASNLGRPLEELVASCRGVTRGGFAFDGHNGLAIVSRHPLRSTEILVFDSALATRAVLHAIADLPEGRTDVYCTHLASDMTGTIDYPEDAPFDSFPEENAAQTEALLDFVDDSSAEPDAVLLGDFNHGPARDGFEAELPDSYRIVIDAGYLDPIAEIEPPQCTFCDDNLLTEATGSGGVIIDHVYLRPDDLRVIETAVIFDAPLEIIGAAGDPVQVNLSDHYGVAVTIPE